MRPQATQFSYLPYKQNTSFNGSVNCHVELIANILLAMGVKLSITENAKERHMAIDIYETPGDLSHILSPGDFIDATLASTTLDCSISSSINILSLVNILKTANLDVVVLQKKPISSQLINLMLNEFSNIPFYPNFITAQLSTAPQTIYTLLAKHTPTFEWQHKQYCPKLPQDNSLKAIHTLFAYNKGLLIGPATSDADTCYRQLLPYLIKTGLTTFFIEASTSFNPLLEQFYRTGNWEELTEGLSELAYRGDIFHMEATLRYLQQHSIKIVAIDCDQRYMNCDTLESIEQRNKIMLFNTTRYLFNQSHPHCRSREKFIIHTGIGHTSMAQRLNIPAICVNPRTVFKALQISTFEEYQQQFHKAHHNFEQGAIDSIPLHLQTPNLGTYLKEAFSVRLDEHGNFNADITYPTTYHEPSIKKFFPISYRPTLFTRHLSDDYTPFANSAQQLDAVSLDKESIIEDTNQLNDRQARSHLSQVAL